MKLFIDPQQRSTYSTSVGDFALTPQEYDILKTGWRNLGNADAWKKKRLLDLLDELYRQCGYNQVKLSKGLLELFPQNREYDYRDWKRWWKAKERIAYQKVAEALNACQGSLEEIRRIMASPKIQPKEALGSSRKEETRVLKKLSKRPR